MLSVCHYYSIRLYEVMVMFDSLKVWMSRATIRIIKILTERNMFVCVVSASKVV